MLLLKNSNNANRIWRMIIVAIIGYIVISIVTVVTPGLLFSFITKVSFNAALDVIMQSILAQIFIMIVTLILIYYWIKLLLDKEETVIYTIGFTGRYFLKVLSGFTFGSIFILLVLAPLYLSHSYVLEYRVLDDKVVSVLIAGLFNYVTVAFAEEIIFRGYIQYQTSKKNKVIGCIITAMIFALFHLMNSSYSYLSLIYLFVGGMMFSTMRLATKSLMFPMGFHLAWNWLLSSIFGIDSDRAWLRTTISKDTWWNGGGIGAESSIFGLIIMILATGGFMYAYFHSIGKKE
ncbi:type II CAAX endopeptidase family protein [Anaerocolumna sp. AGMB13020]|uniref:CPBP family intramembrane glutamic endopeptidase n=1 Tax=Anaerocolumna sp. AGMB13020 TaxID=3081750 RepID=UPI002955DCF0|nr:type II CAAX endopeptidase family protein [Anaerocolumna sp. AGMB13020]WOO39096.1 type II CAAX endopeptidase family protein [Anaerocolumna sp. AGMB13020]